MEDLTSILIVLSVVGFEAISSLILTDYYRQDVIPEPKHRPKITFIYKDSPNPNPSYIIKDHSDLDFVVKNVVLSYLLNNNKSYRTGDTDPHDSKEIKLCEASCKNNIRNLCVLGKYLCTDYTVDYLAHSCYSECNFHLTDPNPYREHLYKEKFRKQVTVTTTTTLPTISTIKTTENYVDDEIIAEEPTEEPENEEGSQEEEYQA